MDLTNTLNRHLQVARNWAGVCRHRSLALFQVWLEFLNRSDIERVVRLRAEVANSFRKDPVCAAKYADHPLWGPLNLNRIGTLALETSAPMRILDIGCGPGYFLALSRAAGHDCYGLDAPAPHMTSIELRVYGEMLAALNCSSNVDSFLIERFVPLEVPIGGMDLITAFWITFNRHRQPDEWRANEWQFFVRDACSRLRAGGLLYLELNPHPERYGRLEWYDAETLDFLRSAGIVNRGVVQIRKT